MMTVNRLIDILSGLPQDSEVLGCISDELAKRMYKIAPEEAAFLLGESDGMKILTVRKNAKQ